MFCQLMGSYSVACRGLWCVYVCGWKDVGMVIRKALQCSSYLVRLLFRDFILALTCSQAPPTCTRENKRRKLIFTSAHGGSLGTRLISSLLVLSFKKKCFSVIIMYMCTYTIIAPCLVLRRPVPPLHGPSLGR